MSNIFSRVKRRHLALLAAGVMSVACSLSCRREVSGNHNTTGYRRKQARSVLVSMVGRTGIARLKNRTYPPCDSLAYVKWLTRVLTDENRYVFPIDESTGKLVDPWGNAIILISEGDSLVALASSGQNGTWETGENDDLVVTFKEFEVPNGPAGTRLP